MLCIISLRLLANTSETAQAEATFLYQSGDHSAAIEKSEIALKANPKSKWASEIKALALKAKGDTAGAIKLITLLSKQNPRNPEYVFELGNLHFQERKFAQSVPYFKKALAAGFNKTACHYFLGASLFEAKKYTEAKTHFTRVTQSKVKRLKGPAYLYLGDIETQQKRTKAAKSHYNNARKFAQETASDENVTPQIRSASEKVLSALGASGGGRGKPWLANAALVTGYDSNVLFVSSAVNSPAEGASGRGSYKQIAQLGFIYFTSPKKEFQFIPVYTGTANYNFNRSTRAGQFITHDLSVYAVRHPRAEINYGFKAGAIYNMRDLLNANTGVQRLRSYNLQTSFGPFTRYKLSGDWHLKADLFFQPGTNFTDDEVTARFRRSGHEIQLRTFLYTQSTSGYFNPTIYFKFLWANPSGSEFKSTEASLEFDNFLYFSSKSILVFRTALAFTYFGSRPDAKRQDWTILAALNYRYKLNKKLSLFSFLDFTKAMSNIEKPYSYYRYQLSVGANYAF